MLERPDTARALFETVRARMATLPPLPVTTYPMHAIDDALRFMSSGVHVGKILVTTSSVPAAARPLPRADCTCAPDDALARSITRALGGAEGGSEGGAEGGSEGGA